MNISSPLPLHPRLNKSRLWCITRHIIHVVYRSKICKQTGNIKVIDAQMSPFPPVQFSCLTQHQALSPTEGLWAQYNVLCLLTVPPWCLFSLSLCPHIRRAILWNHSLKFLLTLVSSAKPWNCSWEISRRLYKTDELTGDFVCSQTPNRQLLKPYFSMN